MVEAMQFCLWRDAGMLEETGRTMITYVRSAVASEATPTEYSVPATEQPSSDRLSSHSASPDPVPTSTG
jgi:hypothetical protein